MRQPPTTRGETSSASAPAGLPPGSGYGDLAQRSCEASRKCTNRKCRGRTAEGRRWWRACCTRRLVALSPDPSRTPRRWWSLRLWTRRGRCGPLLELPDHTRESRFQREGTCRPEPRCVSSEDELWRSIYKLKRQWNKLQRGLKLECFMLYFCMSGIWANCFNSSMVKWLALKR